MTADASALYPAAEERGVAWFRTLRTVLERVERSTGPETAAATATATAPSDASEAPDGAPDEAPNETPDDVSDNGSDDRQDGSVPTPPPPSPETPPETVSSPGLAARLRALSPEAAEVPPDALDTLLTAHAARIAELSAAFGLDAAPLLTALGRGHEPGELDPVTAEAVAAGAEGLGGLIASGSVTVRRDGRGTTLIAALTVGDALGPVRLTGTHWDNRGLTDVWLCAVRPQGRATDTGRALLERILPQIGVLRANLRAVGDRELRIGLRAVDPVADAELVVARLEAWRAAVEQLGGPAIVWEEA